MTRGRSTALLAAVALAGGSATAAPLRADARIFISGHSLTDDPLPRYLGRIAGSLGARLLWDQQNLAGSSLRDRSRREAGLRRAYDALLVTEQHTLLGNIMWNDSVRYLRRIHDRLAAGNPRAVTYLYESWIDVSDIDDPRAWIAYERAAAPVWRCVASRINLSLDREGRADRIEAVPAASALAELVEQATQRHVPGITGRGVRETMRRLFRDSVHLTPLGAYHVALVTYATLYRRSPAGGWAPPEVTPLQAAMLQAAAWRFVERHLRSSHAMSMEACRRYLGRSFVGTYLDYLEETHWKGGNRLGNAARRLKLAVSWRYRFARENGANPFHYDAAHDRGYWFPASPSRS